MSFTVGIDLDNTIINYEAIFQELALESGLTSATETARKSTIRERAWRLPDGDVHWQKLQLEAYGRRIGKAKLYEGVRDFISRCRQLNIRVVVVSHKTQMELRVAATAWLTDKLPEIDPSRDVFFEASRPEKVARIATLGCRYFIDDLAETFAEKDFPPATKKILFSPGDNLEPSVTAQGAGNWATVSRIIFGPSETEISDAVKRKLGLRVVRFEKSAPGGNNRVLKLICENQAELAAKVYFSDPLDSRDRMGVETQACAFLRKNGLGSVPDFRFSEPTLGLAVYEWIDGERPKSEAIDRSRIDEAVGFLLRLRDLSHLPEAMTFPPASEACFSGSELFGSLRRRMTCLESAPPSSPGDSLHLQMQQFVSQELSPALTKLSASFNARELPQECRTLSPSDFGFHNALLSPEGALQFLDFEYFGWDDPVKMVADFLLHPGMKLDNEQKRYFWQKMSAPLSEDPEFMSRFRTYFPVFGLKWCLILLNEFLSDKINRRRFASGAEIDLDRLRGEQLQKARQMLATVTKECENLPYVGA